MSQVWRVLWIINHLGYKLGVNFRVEGPTFSYKVLNYCARRYLLYVKDDREALLGPDQSNDRGWMR